MNGGKAIVNDLNYCNLAKATQVLVTGNVVDGPKALGAANTFFRRATFLAVKSKAGAANGGNVAVGPSATASEQPLVMAPGDERTFEAPVGAKYDLANWYFAVTVDGDGLVIIYS